MKHTRLVKTFVIASSLLVTTLLSADASAQDATFQNGVYTVGFEDSHPAVLIETGFRIDNDDIRSSFILTPYTQKVFSAKAPLLTNMPVRTPEEFRPLVQDITNFFEKLDRQRGFSNEKANGITNWNLAIRIVRLGFCFGTDPRVIAAQIKKESNIDRTSVSGTGAVGFTQMTSNAIDEVNDQFGNRGVANANLENVPYLANAIRCYMNPRPFAAMFNDGTIKKGKLATKDARTRLAAKKWLRANIDRDLVYGQVTLKVLLGKAADSGLRGRRAYAVALARYNGEPNGKAAKYARDILATYDTEFK